MLGKIANKIKHIDIYGKRVSLMHNGNFCFKTTIGGIFTLITFMLTIVFLLLLTIQPIKLVSTTSEFSMDLNITNFNLSSQNPKSQETIEWNKTTSFTKISMHNMRLKDQAKSYLYPYRIFGINFAKRNYDPNFVKFSAYIVNDYLGLNKLINLNTCQDNNTFPQYGNTTHFLCPDSNEFYIDQNYSNNVTTTLSIYIDKCTNSSSCATDEEIKNFYKDNKVRLLLYNSYYDGSNTTNPIQYYLNTNYYIELIEAPFLRIFIDETEVFLKNGSTVHLYESGLLYKTPYIVYPGYEYRIAQIDFNLSPKYYRIIEYDFYQPVVNQRRLNQEAYGKDINNQISFTENLTNTNSTTHSKLNVEDRNSYYVFFVMAQIGGFYSFLRLFFGSIISLFSDRMMTMEIMNLLRAGKKKRMLIDSLKRSNKRKVIPSNTLKPSSSLNYSVKSSRPNKIVARSNTQNSDLRSFRKAKTYENAGCFNPYDQRYVRFIEDRKYFSKTMDISQILLCIQNLRKSVDLLKKTDLDVEVLDEANESQESDIKSSNEENKKKDELDEEHKESNNSESFNEESFGSRKSREKYNSIMRNEQPIQRFLKLNNENSIISYKEEEKKSNKNEISNISIILSREMQLMEDESNPRNR